MLAMTAFLTGSCAVKESKKLLDNIEWLGHDAFHIVLNRKHIYIDPWQVRGGPKADLILLTHGHKDHTDIESISALSGPSTLIVASRKAAEAYQEGLGHAVPDDLLEIVKPGSRLYFENIRIDAVPAYNLNKFRETGLPFHPKEDENVGYILESGRSSLYHTGDSDIIPEMRSISVNIALMPVSGIYVMTRDEALQGLLTGQPSAEIVVPMHIGRGIGSLEDAQYLKEKLPAKVRLLELTDYSE